VCLIIAIRAISLLSSAAHRRVLRSALRALVLAFYDALGTAQSESGGGGGGAMPHTSADMRTLLAADDASLDAQQ
jgi:hypothetical protein